MKHSSCVRVGMFTITLVTLVFLVLSCAGGASVSASEEASGGVAADQKSAGGQLVLTKTPVLVKWTSFYPDGLIDQYAVYKLSEDLRLVLEEMIYDASRPEPVQRIVYDYADGRLSREIIYEAEGGIRSRKEISYDSAGRAVSEKTFDAKDVLISSSTYSFDAAGKMSEWRAMDGTGTVLANVSYRWEDGRLSKIEMTDSSGALSGTVELDYGKNGLPAKRLYRDAAGKLEKYETYSYKGISLVSIERRRSDGKLITMTVYTLGELGERLAETNYDGSGVVLGTVAYEYKVREELGAEPYNK